MSDLNDFKPRNDKLSIGSTYTPTFQGTGTFPYDEGFAAIPTLNLDGDVVKVQNTIASGNVRLHLPDAGDFNGQRVTVLGLAPSDPGNSSGQVTIWYRNASGGTPTINVNYTNSAVVEGNRFTFIWTEGRWYTV